MHISRRLAVAIAVVAGAFGAGSLAAARSHGAHKAAKKGKVVHVIEHAVTDTVVQSGGGKDVTGNTLTFHNQVFNTADKKVVGQDQGWCMRIFPKQGSWECFWTTFLRGGQITVEGPYYDAKNSVLAITGGTGRYAKARGQMNLVSRNGGKEYDFIFHIA